MVVDAPAGAASLRYIDVAEGMAPGLPGPAQLGEKRSQPAHRFGPVLREMFVPVCKGQKEITIIEVVCQSPLQLLEGRPGVQPLPGGGAGLLLLVPGLGGVAGGGAV